MGISAGHAREKKLYIHRNTDFNFLKNDNESGSFIFVIMKSAE